MATSNYSALNDPDVPLNSLSTQVPGRESEGTSRAAPEAARHYDKENLRKQAHKARFEWKSCGTQLRSFSLTAKWKGASRSISEACRAALKPAANGLKPTAILEWLADQSALLYQALSETKAALRSINELPQVTTDGEWRVPRVYAAAASFFQCVRGNLQNGDLLAFLEAIQENSFFTSAELAALSQCLQLVLLERIGAFAEEFLSNRALATQGNEDATLELLHSLSLLMNLNWNVVFEALSRTDQILRDDPAGAFGLMDAESRQRYHAAAANLARRSTWSEWDVAREAVRLARGPNDISDPRSRERRSHVGYYLLDVGQKLIKARIGYNAPFIERVRATIRRWPTLFYLSSIAWIATGILGAVFAESGVSELTPRRLAAVFLIALIPIAECAIAITNLLVTHLLQPERLPRLDFSAGIPEECSTLVAIPILLTSDKQVRQAVRDLEIRYLGNRDRNLHFALVTDQPDSLLPFDEKDALAGLCSSLIEELQEKYASRRAGSFVHLNRHRTYNKTEGIWMGWERKRGKMLDLNNFLLNRTDPFPLKAGNLSCLKNIRYVVTLDQDTQLLADTARKLVGAFAHPLNRAVIDPNTNKVVEGYAILQPRVAISIKSARRSRWSFIYSGDATFDIYTRAVSDVYQDLFGAGIYTGKGIYEVDTFQKLLEHRFPCNAILSHDLIEGAHARAGFISDIELVDDYPSHVSAYSRRKHRWVRGDWQIVLWLFPRVPESLGKLVPNPLDAISRWQILDNLRRSLSEVSTFALLLCGWLLWPRQALFWTVTALILTASPIFLDFFISLLGAGRNVFNASFWKRTSGELASRLVMLLCRITLLCHQGLIALDAVVRTTIRMTVTHRRLLEWETAAQAELKAANTKDTVEKYLDWTVFGAIAIAGLVARFPPSSLWIALPFLMLWGTCKVFCDWLSLPFPKWIGKIGASDQSAIRHMALRTWRFFLDFCTQEENWLIPDVVQVDPPIVVHAASTTNLGLLLNAQLAAYDLGFSTLSDFVTAAERTMSTMSRLATYNGHFYNWYDTLTLEPSNPRFISTVDNSNLVCCLWTLKGACVELKGQPLFPRVLRQGIAAHLDAIENTLAVDSRSDSAKVEVGNLRRLVDLPEYSDREWLKALPKIAARVVALKQELSSWAPDSEAVRWAGALSAQLDKIEQMVRDFTPWLAPEFSELRNLGNVLSCLPDVADLTPETILQLLTNLRSQLAVQVTDQRVKETMRPLAICFSAALSRSLAISENLLERLRSLGTTADRLASAQDFSFLYSPEKELLSVGYDPDAHQLWDSHYDLLASEARAAVFVAIAKGDIPQRAWFRMGRNIARVNGESAMLSWTGTMFEYLMPSLWMKFYPDTLLEQAARVAVLTQRNYAKQKRVPWGISECSCAQKGSDGRYQYRAFGVAELALSRLDAEKLVVSPYSAFLALMTDGPASACNLREMEYRGWLGTYGFCDAYDFTADRVQAGNFCEAVACWMAHHQGMILVSTANALTANAAQRRFHAEPMVIATERLLQEAYRGVSAPVPREPSKLNWLKTSVPVVRNAWKTAVAARETSELSAAQRARESDG